MANVASAQLIEQDKEVGALFRVHETPADERLNNFRSFLGELGLNLKAVMNRLRKTMRLCLSK